MLEEKINNDLKQAMKAKEALKVSCLRMIMADIHNAFIAKQRKLTDEDIIEIMQKQVKQHKDSIDGFKKGNRQDLVDKEAKEIEIIQGYLPEPLSPDEIADIVKKIIDETGAQGVKDMGRVMGAVMSKLKGKADGNLVRAIVNEQLAKYEKKE